MSKSRPSRHFNLEPLETRQLLATIVAGSGNEVNSDILLPNGNTYDQILLTGSTITVKADAGEVTRVDFLDPDGDIIRAELSGAGQLSILLMDFKEAAKPAEYSTDTKYVQGLASFTITGSDASTNFTIYSLGTTNVNQGAANPIFDGGAKDGGDNTAQVSLLTIQADSDRGREFGGIRAGNALFQGDFGFVGIAAGDIRFAGPIILGGMHSTDAGRAVLQISASSPSATITLAGTNLSEVTILNGGIKNIIATGGQNSMGVARDTIEFTPAQAFLNPSEVLSVVYSPTAATLTLDGNTTNAQLASYAKGFFNDVVVKESFTGTFSAKLVRNVTVEGDLDAIIRSGSSVGDIVIEGGIVEGGAIEATTSIGDILVKQAIDFSGSGYNTPVSSVISTIRGAIGNVTFEAAVDLGNGAVPIISSGGNIGRIAGTSLTQTLASITVVQAKGDVESIEISGDFRIAGMISIRGDLKELLGGEVETGEIHVDGSIGVLKSSSGDLKLGSVTAEQSIGLLEASQDLIIDGLTSRNGDIGDLVAGYGIILEARISTENGSIGEFFAGSGNFVVNDEVFSKNYIGNITVAGSNYSLVFGANGKFAAADHIGDVVVKRGGISSSNVGSPEFAASIIGDITVTGDQSTSVLLNDVAFVASGKDARIGDIVLDASANSAGSVAASIGPAVSAVAGAGFSSSGKIGNITIVGHEDGRLLADDADVILFRAGNAFMGSASEDTDAEENEISIGNIVIRANLSELSSARGTGLIIAAGVDVSVGGEFVSGTATAVMAPQKAGDGSIGSLKVTDFGGAAVVGFDRSAIASTTPFQGGSVIVADSIGAIEIEAGDSVVTSPTGTARKGALDTNGDGSFGGVGDLYVIVI